MPTVLTAAFLASVPRAPGVYLMRDAAGAVLYVGKARDLRRRLAAYARPPERLPAKTAHLVARLASVETLITNTEKEALLLEGSLIKKFRPRYNIILRDDKNYPYIKVTVAEEWPRLVVCRRRVNDGSRYFGPYTSAAAMRQTLDLLGRHFPLRRCRGATLRPRKRPCIDFQIGRCLAPCAGLVSREAYQERVQGVLRILDGRHHEIVTRLEAEMRAAAGALEFERAADLRDRIAALRRTLEQQVVISGSRRDLDVVALVQEEGGRAAVAFLFVRAGRLEGKRVFTLDEPVGEEGEILAEVLGRFYASDRFVPPEVLLSHPVEEENMLTSWLSDKAGRQVRLAAPQRGSGRRLLGMAAKNAAAALEEEGERLAAWRRIRHRLAALLELAVEPERIECLDISNLGGRQAVGALVCFEAGEPMRRGYRHYRIRGKATPDDYAMIAEVLARRLAAGKEPPDLLLVDGGRGQLGVAEEIRRQQGLDGVLALAAIAKGRSRGPDRIFLPGRPAPLPLDRHDPALLFLMRVRDEAHRFGIETHRRLRRKSAFTSELDSVPGIGPKRKRLLLRHFGSLARLRRATAEEIARLPGFGPRSAAVVRAALGQGREEGD